MQRSGRLGDSRQFMAEQFSPARTDGTFAPPSLHQEPALKLTSVISALLAVFICTCVQAQEQTDKLSKLVLMKLSRDQSMALCESQAFTQCMGFDQQQCLTLSEKALQKCLGPLPDTIKLSDLQNETLEACPQSVYTDAGYAEEKAQQCLQEALK